MAAINLAAGQADQAVVLEVVEALDPESRADHPGEHHGIGCPPADKMNAGLEHELDQDCLVETVAKRPAALAHGFEVVAFGAPGFEGRMDHGLGREGIKARAARRRIAIKRGGDMDVVPDDMGNLARAIEIADLRIAADEPAQLAALVIELMRGGNQRDHAEPCAGGDHADIVERRGAGIARDPDGGSDIDNGAEQRA